MDPTKTDTIPATGDDPGQAPAATAQAPAADPGDGKNGDGGRTFTQAEVDQVIRDRLAREKEKAAKAAAAARAEAEEAALAEQARHEELAERRLKKVQELEAQLQEREALQDRLEVAEAALAVYRDQLLEGVPEPIRALLENRPVAEQLAWLTEFKATAASNGDGRPPVPGTPRPQDRTLPDAERKKKAFTIRSL